MTYRLGILLSGRGSNFAAIQNAIESGILPNTQITIVMSNHAEAPGLQIAQNKGLKTHVQEKVDYENRLAFDEALIEIFQAHQVDLVILAGYDRILSTPFLTAYPDRILNIHPSLLPAYGGKSMVGYKVHQAVLAAGEKISGCTVHLVTADVDGGPILGQSRVSILPDDTPESLAARILAEEHRLYPRVIREYIEQNGHRWQMRHEVNTHAHTPAST